MKYETWKFKNVKRIFFIICLKIKFVIPAPLPDRTPSFVPPPIGLTQDAGKNVDTDAGNDAKGATANTRAQWPRANFLSPTVQEGVVTSEAVGVETKIAVDLTSNNGVGDETKIAAGDTSNNGVGDETKIAIGDTSDNGVGVETKIAIDDTNNNGVVTHALNPTGKPLDHGKAGRGE